jgi:mono/diheme cytochrome c family protein
MRGVVLLLAIAMGASGCEKAMRDMYDQPKLKPLAQSPLWSDERSGRNPVKDTIPRSAGSLAGTSSGRLGEVALAPDVPPLMVNASPTQQARLAELRNPLPRTRAWLDRGRERFNIYCSPCHSEAGDGDGMVVRRGFPAPPSYHIERLRNAPDAHFYAVITHGYGTMYSYADRVDPQDRWAIVLYIRALQFSQNARLQDVPEAERRRMEPQP